MLGSINGVKIYDSSYFIPLPWKYDTVRKYLPLNIGETRQTNKNSPAPSEGWEKRYKFDEIREKPQCERAPREFIIFDKFCLLSKFFSADELPDPPLLGGQFWQKRPPPYLENSLVSLICPT